LARTWVVNDFVVLPVSEPNSQLPSQRNSLRSSEGLLEIPLLWFVAGHLVLGMLNLVNNHQGFVAHRAVVVGEIPFLSAHYWIFSVLKKLLA